MLGVTTQNECIVLKSSACGSKGITDTNIEILVVGFCLQMLLTIVCIALN